MSRRKDSHRILMLLENACFPDDNRVLLEAESLIEAGFEVSVICPTGPSKKWVETIGATRVYRYPKPPEISHFLGYVLEYSYSLAALFVISVFVAFRRGFDAVHVHTPPDMTGLIANFYQLFGKQFVFDLHDLSPELYMARRGDERKNSVYRALRFFERLACGSADRLIATNVTQRDVQVNRCGAKADHCYIVRNGPDVRFLSHVEPRPELRMQGQLVLGYVGVIGVQDGVDVMVRVVHELKTRYQRDDFIAVIVGGGSALAELKSLAKELGVADMIHFTGMIPITSVPAYIASFDICFTPDPSNPYNDSCTTIKTLEYMALRKPTVCFRTHENQVTADDAALYADKNDVTAFAKLTIQLMDDPDMRQAMGTIARQRIDDGLTWDHQAGNLIALYEDLFGLPSRASSGSPEGEPAEVINP